MTLLFKGRTGPILSGLQLWGKMDEGSGTFLGDSSVNGIDGALGSASNWYASGPLGNSARLLSPNGAIFPDSSYLDIIGPITILARIRQLSTTSGERGIVTRVNNDGETHNTFDLRLVNVRTSVSHLDFVRADGAGVCINRLTDASIPVGEWMNVGVRSTSGNICELPTFLVGGSLIDGAFYAGNSSGVTASISAPTLCGIRGDEHYSADQLQCDVRIYNRALSDAEMLAYNDEYG